MVQRGANMKLVGNSHCVAEPTASVATLPERHMNCVMRKEDEQLMADYAQGDLAAFKTLYERYETPVYRFAYNGCRNEADARELFQDVWLRVVKSRSSFTTQRPFKAWLFTIARNRLTDSYRYQASRALTHSNEPDLQSGEGPPTLVNEQSADDGWWATSLTPEQIASASQQSDTLQIALQKLPEHQREAIMLKHIAGMNLDEVAAVQAEGVETVKSRLRYAMVKLRKYLKEQS